MANTTSLTIYDSTPISCEAQPGDDFVRFHVGIDGMFAHSNADIAVSLDALKVVLDLGAAALKIAGLPDPEDEDDENPEEDEE